MASIAQCPRLSRIVFLNGLSRILEFGDVVFYNSFDCRIEMKSIAKGLHTEPSKSSSDLLHQTKSCMSHVHKWPLGHSQIVTPKSIPNLTEIFHSHHQTPHHQTPHQLLINSSSTPHHQTWSNWSLNDNNSTAVSYKL